MPAWLDERNALLWWLAALSLVMFVGTLLLLPIIVARLPADYFTRHDRHSNPPQGASTVLRLLVLIGKNVLGIVFILAGMVMLVLPGQGILTLLIGLMLVNFPGKRRLERRLVQQAAVLRAINWIRAKAHQPALQVPPYSRREHDPCPQDGVSGIPPY